MAPERSVVNRIIPSITIVPAPRLVPVPEIVPGPEMDRELQMEDIPNINNPVVGNEPEPIEQGDVVMGDAEDGDDGAAADAGGRNRVSRKVTKWIFVDKIDGNNVYCKCGCLSSNGTSRLKYAASTSGHADRHAKTNHGALYAEFLRCQNNQGI